MMLLTMITILGLIIILFDLFWLIYGFLEDRRIKNQIRGIIDKIEEDMQKHVKETEGQE